MAYTKGISGNPKGKPKGTKNKKSEQWNELSNYILNSGADRFIQEMEKLEGIDYISAYSKMICYFKPKLQSVSASVETIEPPVISIIKTYDKYDNEETFTIPKRV